MCACGTQTSAMHSILLSFRPFTSTNGASASVILSHTRTQTQICSCSRTKHKQMSSFLFPLCRNRDERNNFTISFSINETNDIQYADDDIKKISIFQRHNVSIDCITLFQVE